MCAKKTNPKKLDKEQVQEYMNLLHHPLKSEIEAVRSIILKAHPLIQERIKWNAPSYYAREDLVTFNPRLQERVHLVFHHPNIVKVKSELLEGDYKDRRMMYFNTMKEIKSGKAELERIMKELIRMLEQ